MSKSKSLFYDKRVNKSFLLLSENEKITDSLQWPKFPVFETGMTRVIDILSQIH